MKRSICDHCGQPVYYAKDSDAPGGNHASARDCTKALGYLLNLIADNLGLR